MTLQEPDHTRQPLLSRFPRLIGGRLLSAQPVDLYRNEESLPRAFVEEDQGRVREARVAEWTPNRIRVEAEGPDLLVLSEIYDTDWRAAVDGEAAEVVRVEGILRGVHLEGGSHQVAFVIVPPGLVLA